MHGIRANLDKCLFMQNPVECLGQVVDNLGFRTSQMNVQAVVKAPPPTNAKELRPFLGMISYYCEFIPGLEDMLKPLTNLLQNNSRWVWNSECMGAFTKAKPSLTSATVLAH